MLKRYRSAAVGLAALMLSSAALWAAGNWSTLPIVGGAAFCASTVTGTGGLGGITGQGQGTTGSICGQTVPIGPTIVTGTELIPADTNLTGGAPPQTVVLSLGSLNAFPLSVTTVLTNNTNNLSATNIMGGYILHAASASAISTVNLSLPPNPIDGQQFALSSDQTVTTLAVVPSITPTGTTITNRPTVITNSTTVAYGYRFVYNAAANNWYRMM